MRHHAPALLTVFALAACASAPSAAPSEPSMATSAVTGSVVWRERILLPPTTKVIVRLQDVSLADAPAKVISEQVLDARTSPVAFALPYDPGEIAPGARFSISARVEVNGQLRFISDTHFPVINGGPTEGVTVLVEGVAQ